LAGEGNTHARNKDVTEQRSAGHASSSDFIPNTLPLAFGLTDIGRKRNVNQDQFLVAQLNKSMLVTSTSMPLEKYSRLYGGVQGQVLMVADGMGGHAAGEKASSLAVDHLIDRLLNSIHWFFKSTHEQADDQSRANFVNDLKSLLQDAHSRILHEAATHQSQTGMGTTVTMAHVIWPHLYVVHAGDSRCYLFRNGRPRLLTTDHTLARQMVEAGGMRPEDEAKSRWSNVLWNVLGGRSETGLLAEVHQETLFPGDIVLLCSDGLSRYLDGDAMAQVVNQESSPEAICQRLIDLANQAGGEDNITVVVSKPLPPGEADPRVSPIAAEYLTINEEDLNEGLEDTLLE